MQINVQMNSVQPQAAFKGTVDKAVIQKIRTLEAQTIARQISQANSNGIAVNPKIIEEIKSRFEKVIETLTQKAELLFKDSVITVRKDTGQIYVDNKKLSNQYSNILDRFGLWTFNTEGEPGKFKELIKNKLAQKDPVVMADKETADYMGTIYSFYPTDNIEKGIVKTVDELEYMVKHFNPDSLNELMLYKEKNELKENIKFNKIDSAKSKIKKQVRNIYDVEKELPVEKRTTGLWSDVKK